MRKDHAGLAGAVGAIATETDDTLVRRGIYVNCKMSSILICLPKKGAITAFFHVHFVRDHHLQVYICPFVASPK